MFNTKTAVRKIIGNTKRGGKNDWDGDGVPNRKDCQPRNTMRQDTDWESHEKCPKCKKKKIKWAKPINSYFCENCGVRIGFKNTKPFVK